MHQQSRHNIVNAILALIIPITLVGSLIPSMVMGQENNTQQQNKTDYTGFHSNMEQIIGHIEMAKYNKFFNNDTLALSHTLHPIEEVLTLITIPLTQSDNNLNETYFSNLHQLSELASPGKSTINQFENHSESSIAISNRVIATVVPENILNSIQHNASVIRDLLTVSGAEYAEGVQAGNITLELEYQDGSAFIDRAYALFNGTQNNSNDTKLDGQIISDFSNLTNSVQNLKDPSEVNQIIQKINSEMISDENGTTTNSTTLQSSENYVGNIETLLEQVIIAYQANDKVKAKELATTAYLDNFEYIEKPIGEELSDRGEALLREKLQEQLNSNTPIDEIKQNIADINKVLDDSRIVLNNSAQ